MTQQTQPGPSTLNGRDETESVRLPLPGRVARYIRRKIFFDNPALGLIVEIKGNRVSVGGLQFDVSDSCISRGIKGRFVLGLYEQPEIESIERDLDRSLPVVELGACIGVVSCVTNKFLVDRRQHVVVEANPSLVPIIEKNRALNGGAFDVVNAALAYDQETVTFYVGRMITASALRGRKGSPITVPTITLAHILQAHHFDRVNLIVDIEGAEYELVMNEPESLSRNVARIFMEVHDSALGPHKLAAIFSRLEDCGFEVSRRIADNYVFRNKAFS